MIEVAYALLLLAFLMGEGIGIFMLMEAFTFWAILLIFPASYLNVLLIEWINKR